MEQKTSDIATVSTLLGYVKIKCSPSTTVDEIIKAAVKKVSISNSPSIFGLEIRESSSNTEERHFLCPSLTWSEIAVLANEQNVLLSIRYFPTNFEDSVRKDRSALSYLHDQVNRFYKCVWEDCKDSQACFEIGCLEIKLSLESDITEESLDQLEKFSELQHFFPSHVLQQQKAKLLRRAIINHAPSIHYFSQEDCMLERLNRLLILTKFDSDSYACYLGAGLGIPVRLLLGPRSQVRVNIGNAKEVRMLCYFASIGQIILSEVTRKEGRRFQIKLILSNDGDAGQPIIFTFESKLTADTVLHTLEGYCKLSPDMRESRIVEESSSSVCNGSLLSTGCPFRTQRVPSSYDSPGKSSQSSMTLIRSQIALERVLGEGQFGDVYKGAYRPTKAGSSAIPVAVKACRVGLNTEEKQRWLEEAELHGRLTHPHIIQLYGTCKDDPIWLVLEFAQEGELRHYLLERQNQIPLTDLVTFCHQLSSALAYLEAVRIIHRDVAARNVLVASSSCIKLGDFGMARDLKGQDFYCAEQGKKVPIKWMAPESLQSRIFSSASDVWMFGVCMWEILSYGLKPFHNITNSEAVAAISRGERLPQPAICLSTHYRLILECWMFDPVLRPTCASLQPKLREVLAEAKRLSMDTRDQSPYRKASINGVKESSGTPDPSVQNKSNGHHSPENPMKEDKSEPRKQSLPPPDVDDQVHNTVREVIEQIITITKLAKPPSPKQLLFSVKTVGLTLRELFVMIQQTVEEIDDVSLIDSAERQLNDSYYYLIEDMKKLRDFYRREDIRDELYRRFLVQASVVACDVRTLYQSMQQCRQAHTLLHAHR